MIKALQIALVEIRWFIASALVQLKAKVIPLRPSTSGASALNWEIYRREEEVLCSLLREVPWWVRGHGLLGLALMRQVLEGSERIDLRVVRRIGVCGRAIGVLGARKSAFGRWDYGCKAVQSFLLGMEAFFLRDYQLASEALEEALTSVGLPKQPELGVLAREHLGGALMALGSYQQALKSFEAIPEEQRRTSVKEALFYLNEKLC